MNYEIFPLNILLDVNIISVCVRWDGRDLSLALELTLAAMTHIVTLSQPTLHCQCNVTFLPWSAVLGTRDK